MTDGRDERYRTPLGESDPTEVEAFWQRYLLATGGNGSEKPPIPMAWAFGDSVELADELIGLVLNGPKRATAGAVAEFEADGEPIPSVGDLSIVTDGAMRPRAVIETTDVRIGPLSSVDDRFAWDEGEGDRTRQTWLDDHTWYFTRSFQRLGLEFHADIDVVFERFEVRYREEPVRENPG